MTSPCSAPPTALYCTQAQESPDSVYDLTDCGLKTVPPGVFSRIKVLRKEALLLQVPVVRGFLSLWRCVEYSYRTFALQENELVSLSGGGNLPDLAGLQVLDLHNNCLEKLPEELGQLTGLQVSVWRRARNNILYQG